MKKCYEFGKPLLGSRACVIEWDMKLRFKLREQCDKFIELLVKEGKDFNFSKETYHNGESQIFEVSINDMPWGYNIDSIAAIATAVDYNDDCTGE